MTALLNAVERETKIGIEAPRLQVALVTGAFIAALALFGGAV